MSGLLTGRALDAVVLVLTFGVGMAVTLTAVGVVTIHGHGLLTRRIKGRAAASVVAAWTPVAAGVAVSLAGCLYLAAGVIVLTA
ncbi:hypothetical protein OG320_11025 [Microbispora sp. NBC_01189]|uniref:hypothetical protein n=1 Tax=Microbispora sp. NBC_01189 TaxID=2903583 RepID=UPI002E13E132|nr:hypothetical protein OG320_11025 [Microbispora sp. NBC_01189]